MSVQFGPSWEDMQRFYRLHLLTRRRPGVPVQPLRFLRAVWRHMAEPGPGFLALACTSDTPVAAALFLVHRQTLIYKYGASDASHWELKPNYLLFWSVIERACEEGLTLLDLVRATRTALAFDGSSRAGVPRKCRSSTRIAARREEVCVAIAASTGRSVLTYQATAPLNLDTSQLVTSPTRRVRQSSS